MRLLSLILLAGCSAPSPVMTTRCGLGPPLKYEDGSLLNADWLTMETLQWAEDEVLWYFERGVRDHRLNQRKLACSTLTQIKIFVHPTPTWGPPGKEVYGLAFCGYRTIEIGTPADGRWQNTGIPHELAHIMQDCKPRLPAEDGQDEQHANWERDGIHSAIEAIWKH